MEDLMARTFNYDILEIIKERWSARAIDQSPIPLNDIKAVMEAARYAPSCFNEQPWRYLVAYENEDLTVMRSYLTEKNMKWAGKAPVLMMVLSSNVFHRNQKANKWNQFDAGTSWGFMQLEAWKRGYITHGMAGFNADRAREELNIPEDHDIICMVAMGRYGNLEELDPLFHPIERPNERNPLESMMLNVDTFIK